MPLRYETTKRKLLQDLQRGLRESVDSFTPKNKRARNSWVGLRFLENLGINFDEKDVIAPFDDHAPPDIIFKDARFEIKDILDPGRKMHLEYKERLRKSLAVKDPADLFEHCTLHYLTPNDILGLIQKELPKVEKKYEPRVRAQHDLLFYVNLRHHRLKIAKMPDSYSLSNCGWRSVSSLIGRGSLVFYANDLAPGFLQEKRGQLTIINFGYVKNKDPVRKQGLFCKERKTTESQG